MTKVRALLAGQPAQLGHAPGARPLRLGQPPAPDVPIWVAALGPRTTLAAAELGDGWIPALVARDRLPVWTARLNRLRETTARTASPDSCGRTDHHRVENADAAPEIVAPCIAWYLGAMGDIYPRAVPGQGYATEVAPSSPRTRGPAHARGIIPPAAQGVLDQFAAYGTRDQVREQLEPWDPQPTSSQSCATRHALAHHRDHPLCRSARRPAGVRPRGLSAAAAGQATPTGGRPGKATPPKADRPSGRINTHACMAAPLAAARMTG